MKNGFVNIAKEKRMKVDEFGIRIETVEEVFQCALKKRALHTRYGGFGKCKPAAVFINQNACSLLNIIRIGLYIYERKNKPQQKIPF